MKRYFSCNLALAFPLLFLLSVIGFPQDSSKSPSAQAILNQARVAIGGEEKLKAIKGLLVVYKFRRAAANGEQRSGETRLDFLLPDKYVRNETRDLPRNVGQVITFSLLNGDQAMFDVRTTTSAVPVLPKSPANAEKEKAELLKRLRKESAFYLLQLLLASAPTSPFDFTYAGEAQAEDGRADAIDVKGPDDFKVRLFFDKETHRLLLMSYYEPAPQEVVIGPPGKDTPRPRDSAPEQPDVEVRLRFSDHREEDGILVPHFITREKNGMVEQETELKSFKVNPTFKADHFDAKHKR